MGLLANESLLGTIDTIDNIETIEDGTYFYLHYEYLTDTV